MRATRERRGGSAGGPGPRGPREGHQGAGDRPQRPLPEPRRGAPSGRGAAARQVLSRAPPSFGKVAWVGRPALGVRLMAASGGRAGLPTGGPTGCLAIGPAARPHGAALRPDKSFSRAPHPFGKVAWIGRSTPVVCPMAAPGVRAGPPTSGPTGCLAIRNRGAALNEAASRSDKSFPAPPSSGRRRGSSALRRLRRPAPSWSREGARPEEPETWLFWFVGFGGCRLHLGHTCASGGARKRGAPTGAPLGKGVPDRIAEG